MHARRCMCMRMCMCVYVFMYVYVQLQIYIKPCFVFGFDVCEGYEFAMSSRLLKMIGHF